MTDPFDDDDLVRALRGPATPGETADEDRYRAMFRETRGGGKVVPLASGSPRRPGSRAARRFGAGTTLSVVIAAAASGGVAAAYTNHLPEPIQTFAHEMLRPLKVPAPEPERKRPDRIGAEDEPSPSPSASPSPSEATAAASPAATPEPSKNGEDDSTGSQQAEPSGEPSDLPSASPSATSSVSAAPSSTTTPTPTATPTPTPTEDPTIEPPPAPVAGTLSISGSSHRVAYGGSPTFSGYVLDDSGEPLADVRVRLMQRTDGVWSQVGFATSDAEGAVYLTAPPVYETVGLRLKTKGARSDAWRVAMEPTLDLSASVQDDTVTITATAVGGQEGDVVRLGTRRDGRTVVLGTGILGPGGSVTFQVEQTTKKVRYGALLERTDDHTADRASVVVIKPQTPKDGDPAPEESASPQP